VAEAVPWLCCGTKANLPNKKNAAAVVHSVVKVFQGIAFAIDRWVHIHHGVFVIVPKPQMCAPRMPFGLLVDHTLRLVDVGEAEASLRLPEHLLGNLGVTENGTRGEMWRESLCVNPGEIDASRFEQSEDTIRSWFALSRFAFPSRCLGRAPLPTDSRIQTAVLLRGNYAAIVVATNVQIAG